MKKLVIVKGEQLNKKMYMKPMYVAEDVLLVFEDKKGKLTEKTADELIEFYKEKIEILWKNRQGFIKQ